MAEKNPFAFTKYESAGGVGLEYLAQKDNVRAEIALRQTPVDNDGRLLLDNVKYLNTSEGRAEAIGIFASQFQEGLSNLTYAQAREFYGSAIDKLPDETRKNALALLKQYGEKTIGSIEQAYMAAVEILKNKDAYKRRVSELVSKEGVEEAYKNGIANAEKTKAKYEPIVNLRNILQEERNAPIEGKVRKSLAEVVLQPEVTDMTQRRAA